MYSHIRYYTFLPDPRSSFIIHILDPTQIILEKNPAVIVVNNRIVLAEGPDNDGDGKAKDDDTKDRTPSSKDPPHRWIRNHVTITNLDIKKNSIFLEGILSILAPLIVTNDHQKPSTIVFILRLPSLNKFSHSDLFMDWPIYLSSFNGCRSAEKRKRPRNK